MFAQVISDFNERVKEVDLYFDVLLAIENGELAVLGAEGPQILPVGSPPGDWGRMLKGAAFLVLYNLVEAFCRRGFQAVFDTIKSDSVCGIDLSELFRKQWIMQKNRRVATFDGSPKVYMEIANEILSDILAKKPVRLRHDRLPISGNLDAAAVRSVCDAHGIDPTVPPEAKGGSALDQIKDRRNGLAHGDESFVEAGRDATAADLVVTKNEVVLFMRSILSNLEKYAMGKEYKA